MDHSILLNQKPVVIWMTGLSGSGKSTIAEQLQKYFFNLGYYSIRLDGDDIRTGLCKDLGFSAEDRRENIRRVAELAKILYNNGAIVICSFISPMDIDRAMAKQIIGKGFFEIYVKASLDTCLQRDVKGHYKSALEGTLKEFTGISSPYETPSKPDLVIDSENQTVETCVQMILSSLKI